MRSPISAIRRHEVEQLDLLHVARQIPTWRSLPAEVHERTVPLLARVLSEHRSRHLGGGAREVDDE